jgi:SH3-like domain-containing protein
MLAALAAIGALSQPASAQESDVPYWASLNADEINMRVGPSANYPIEWVYRRVGLPVKVERTMQGWRYVRDPDGEQGWIVGRLLSRDRGAIVIGNEPAEIREGPDAGARLMWRVESGVVGHLGDCEDGWCEFNTDGHAGWIAEDRLWGPGEP